MLGSWGTNKNKIQHLGSWETINYLSSSYNDCSASCLKYFSAVKVTASFLKNAMND